MGCTQGEKLLHHEDPMGLRPRRVQRSNHRMYETKFIVTRGRRDAQKWHSPDPAGVRDQGFTRRIACAGATQASKSVKGTNSLVKLIKEVYTSLDYPNTK